MKKPRAVLIVAIASFILGLVASEFVLSGADAAAPAESEWQLPIAAQKAWFPPVSDYTTEGEPLDDEKFEALMTAVEQAMTAEETLADFKREAEVHLMNFIRRLSPSEVSDDQKDQVKAYLAALAEEHPDHAGLINARATLVDSYSEPREGSPPSLSGSLLIFGEGDEFNPDGDLFDDSMLDEMMTRLGRGHEHPRDAGKLRGRSPPPLPALRPPPATGTPGARAGRAGHGLLRRAQGEAPRRGRDARRGNFRREESRSRKRPAQTSSEPTRTASSSSSRSTGAASWP